MNREDMQSIFDPHIASMLKKIREQLDFVRVKAFGNPQVVSADSPPAPVVSSLTPDTAIFDTLRRAWQFRIRARLPAARAFAKSTPECSAHQDRTGA